MKIEVLVSCMYQNDTSIVTKTNIQSDAIIINQCNEESLKEFKYLNKYGDTCRILFISTMERGLSKSRNMAIRNSSADICLICDDDEVLEDNYVNIITNEFSKYSENVLAFRIKHPTRKFKNYTYPIGYFKIGTLGSWQLAFRREEIVKNQISFNEKMGSGTGNGAGEENRFVMDCYKKNLGIRYVPELIGTIIPTGESQWFHGYTKEYWTNRGWQSKMIYGKFIGYLHIWQAVLRHKKDKAHSLWQKIKWINKGYFLNR